ncbi:hypothetical protein LINPERPRIM_LOCUS30671 [Linum perenne]
MILATTSPSITLQHSATENGKLLFLTFLRKATRL